MSEAESARRLHDLLARLEATLAALEGAEASDEAVDRLTEMSELARDVQAEIDRLRREGAEDAPP